MEIDKRACCWSFIKAEWLRGLSPAVCPETAHRLGPDGEDPAPPDFLLGGALQELAGKTYHIIALSGEGEGQANVNCRHNTSE